MSLQTSVDAALKRLAGAQKDTRDRVFAFKRDTVVATGVDQALEVQTKLDALADGGTLQIIGQVRISVPIVARRNKTIRGEVSPRWSYQTTPPTSLRPTSGFVGKAALLIPEHTIVDATLPAMTTARTIANDNGRIENLVVDCSAISPGGDRGIYGILFEGLVRNWEIRNTATLSARGIGIAFRQERGTGVPRGITAEHLQSVYSKSYGFYLAYTTDSNMVDLLAVGGETDGHYHLACAETHFEDVRAVFNKGRGVVLAGVRSVANVVSYGSISTDRNAMDGLSIQESGTFPLRIGTATLNRDGSASDVLDYAGLVLGADTVRISPVSIGYLSVIPGVDDPAAAGQTGGGILSPQHVVRQGNTTRVEIGTRLGWSAGTPIFESGGTHSNPPFTSYDYLRTGESGTVITSKNWIDSLAASGGGGATVVPDYVVRDSALRLFFQRIAKRDTEAAPVVSVGSSTWYGQGANSDPRRTMNRFVAGLQEDYPLSSGTAQPAAKYLADVAGTTLPAGIQYINASKSGTTSATVLTDAQIQQIMALKPAMIDFAIGSNDYADNMAIATYKANLKSIVDKMKAAAVAPVVYVFTWGHRRINPASPPKNWSDYGQAMSELAADDPDNSIFFNLYTRYREAGQDSGDPRGWNDADGIHLNDAGHAFGADVKRDSIRGSVPFRNFVYTVNPTVPATPAITNTAVPVISGTPTQGQTLTTTNGTWSVTPDSYTYQWKRGGSNISGATAASYVLDGTDVGTQVTVMVTAIKSGYTSGSATSAATATIAASQNPVMANTTAPSISPTSAVAGTDTLTANPGVWSPTADSYTYQWNRSGAAISGATAATYPTVAGDAGLPITVTVTAIKSGYTSASATSASVTPTAPVSGGTKPDYTTGMLAEYDANTLSGADGSAISTWTATGGTAAPATMNQVVAMPTVLAGAVNGRKAIRFIGGSNSTAPSLSVLGGALTVPRECTWFYVIRRTGPMLRAIGSGQNESNRHHSLFDQTSSGGIDFAIGSVSAGTTERLATTIQILNEWIIIGVQAKAAGVTTSRMKLSCNTAGKSANIVGNLINSTDCFGITLGTSGSRTGSGMFDMAHLRVYNTVLSDANFQIVMEKLGEIYGIAVTA